MRVFVTGASGWIGSAVVPELIAAGHTVTGLVRSDSAAEALTAAGGTPVRGTLTDLDTIRSAAAESDGVVHMAFIHDFSNIAESACIDLAVIQTIGSALVGSGRPFVIPGGVIGLSSDGQPATEDEETLTVGAVAPRQANIAAAFAFGAQGVRIIQVRFAPTVHGQGDHGFMATYTQIAREKGVAGYVGDGTNRWPAVHRFDAASLVRLGLEKASAGSFLHGVGEEGVRIRDVAEVIGRKYNISLASIPADQAAEHFGWLGMFIGADSPASSALTRERMNWQPTHHGLLADLADYY
jgi:nucleoside-diphosphate-sugar epimerase